MPRTFVALALALLLSGLPADAADSASWRFVRPARIALASCTDFEWVTDVPMCLETARLIELASTRKFGVPADRVHTWANGSSEEFLNWLKTLEEKGAPDQMLVLYFVTHQFQDGRFKFSKGDDLPAAEMLDAVNRLARRYDRVILVDDCCYGALLEGGGKFFENVTRIYAASEDEEAINVRFGKGPYGLDDFVEKERAYLKQALAWEPPGMSFLGLIGLKSALEISKNPGDSVDLQGLVRRMGADRDRYDESIRQKKVQHIILVPSTANFEILAREGNAR